MGTVTLILKAFSDEEINVYDAMNKVQKLDAFKFDFPPVVENYFEHSIGSKSGRGMAYHHNVSTIATSGCQIFHIARPNFGFSKEKLYVEKMLFAMPSYHDEGKVSYFLLGAVHKLRQVFFEDFRPPFPPLVRRSQIWWIPPK